MENNKNDISYVFLHFVVSGELTVTEFNKIVGEVVSSSRYLHNVRVIGEISEWREYKKLTWKLTCITTYITLKDDNSALKCILFQDYASKITLPTGTKVIASGEANYYNKGGSFNFKIESIIPVAKEGEQHIALKKLEAKLTEEGLFDKRKKEIPRYPKTIGVVTSSEGAVIEDIINVVSKRFPVNILLSPATVQGVNAPQSIVDAIKLLETQNVDVMIIGRGGGSIDDLSAFNDESVVRAVSNCKIPTISAVGHAKDETLCDKIADKYAETPSVAAVIATRDKNEEKRKLKDLWKCMKLALSSIVNNMENRYKEICKGIKLSLKYLCDRLNKHKDGLYDFQKRLNMAIELKIEMESMRLDNFTEKLNSLNPSMVLSRGYSLIINDQGNVVASVSNLLIGTKVNIKMKDGIAIAEIKGAEIK